MFDSGKIKKIIFDHDRSVPTYIVAEIGINHNGSLDVAIELARAAKKAGADAVKLQKRDLSQIYSSIVLSDANNSEWTFEYLLPLLKEFELSKQDYGVIREECNSLEIDLIVTPFDEVSASFVTGLGVSALKIASADMTNIPLLQACHSYELPMLISVGMWEESDIRHCVDIYKDKGFRYALLMAQSTYPASYDTLNLGFLKQLAEFSPVFGYSGHERGTFIPVAAVALGCRIIEKHITFDRNEKGPDHKASMLPDEWEQMVYQIRMLERSLGQSKEINQAEKLSREAFAKSAVPLRDLPVDHILNKADVTFRAPGKGVFPHQIAKYYGRPLKKGIKKDHYINETDFEDLLNISDWKKFSFKKQWGVKCRFHDYDEFKILNTPCIEFHCSQTDLDANFAAEESESLLVVHAPEIYDRQLVDICLDDKTKVDESLDILQRSIDKTLEIAKYFPKHRPKMVTHLGGMSLDVRQMDNTAVLTERAIANFERLDFSKDEIEILPENLPPHPWYLGGEWFQHGFMHAEDMIAFCAHFNLKMAYDVCHASLYCNRFNISLVDYTQQVMPYVSHLHISDAEGINGEGVQIGQGTMDFNTLMAATKEYPFSWVPEIWSGHLHQARGMYQCLVKLEEYTGAL